MEFHQVRYFMALSSTLNFTRAAEECNVSQPALTRAIQMLEHEFGGPLVTREGRLTHLTELGQRVLPVLRDCYRKAEAARALARESRDGEQAMLRLAAAGTVGLDCIAPALAQVIKAFPGVEIRVVRGTDRELLEHLKFGHADVAITDGELAGWERLEAWPVGREPYSVVVDAAHKLATRDGVVPIGDLAGERIICLPDCALARKLIERLAGGERRTVCEVPSVSDIFTLLRINAGIALLPDALELPDRLVRIATTGMELDHMVRLYAVAGRQRVKAVAALADRIARPRSPSCVGSIEPSLHAVAA